MAGVVMTASPIQLVDRIRIREMERVEDGENGRW
jgi:hypothetical protein